MSEVLGVPKSRIDIVAGATGRDKLIAVLDMDADMLYRRILAYLIDSLAVFLIFVLGLQYALFVPLRHLVIGSEAWFLPGWHTELYTLLTISLPTWLYFIFMEISPWKATLGKRLLGLQTLGVTSKGRISLGQSILRTLIKLLPWELAHLNNNLPTPMWYTENPGFRIGFALIPGLILGYLLVAWFTPKKQAPHDLAAGTAVFTAPQQPKTEAAST